MWLRDDHTLHVDCQVDCAGCTYPHMLDISVLLTTVLPGRPPCT